MNLRVRENRLQSYRPTGPAAEGDRLLTLAMSGAGGGAA